MFKPYVSVPDYLRKHLLVIKQRANLMKLHSKHVVHSFLFLMLLIVK